MPENEKHFLKPENDPTIKLSLLEDFETCVAAVISIEGEWFTKIDVERSTYLRRAVGAAKEALIEHLAVSREEGVLPRKYVCGFEGIDGGNRYLVLSDGRIELSNLHTISACITKAQQLGIDVN